MILSRKTAVAAHALALLLIVTEQAAAETTYQVFLDGSQEVGAGDPTATGSGTVTVDPEADTISWNVQYFDLSNPFPKIYPISVSGWHIHGPGGSAGNNASILVDLNDLSGAGVPDGVLIGTDLSAPGADIDAILANPTDFYLNLHTSDQFQGAFAGFPGGAIRGQLPEPDALALGGASLLSLACLCRLRRRSGRAGSIQPS